LFAFLVVFYLLAIWSTISLEKLTMKNKEAGEEAAFLNEICLDL